MDGNDWIGMVVQILWSVAGILQRLGTTHSLESIWRPIHGWNTKKFHRLSHFLRTVVKDAKALLLEDPSTS